MTNLDNSSLASMFKECGPIPVNYLANAFQKQYGRRMSIFDFINVFGPYLTKIDEKMQFSPRIPTEQGWTDVTLSEFDDYMRQNNL